mgnify:CR=1 FL=1
MARATRRVGFDAGHAVRGASCEAHGAWRVVRGAVCAMRGEQRVARGARRASSHVGVVFVLFCTVGLALRVVRGAWFFACCVACCALRGVFAALCMV